MNLDIQTTVRTIFIFLLIACSFVVLTAVRVFREAGRLRFFLKKRELLGRAWKYVFFAVLIAGFAILVNTFAEPLTYSVFPPSPTVTQTPTITLTSTVTQTPTVTITPTMTQTPEFTSTPIMPAVISQDFTSKVTPNPEAVFSNLAFSRQINEEYQPINPASSFENPIDIIYGSFSYDRMITNSQWSALWFRDGELVFYETKPWNGASGGFGYTDCRLPADQWLPGAYEVQIFVGETWRVSGRFTVTGTPPTPTITSTPTITKTPTSTLTPTRTSVPTSTVTLTGTLIPTLTLSPSATMTITPSLTSTSAPANSKALLPTQKPSGTPTKTLTPSPSNTPTATLIPSPTLVPTATRFSTIYR
jgi:hypothetical protein